MLQLSYNNGMSTTTISVPENKVMFDRARNRPFKNSSSHCLTFSSESNIEICNRDQNCDAASSGQKLDQN